MIGLDQNYLIPERAGEILISIRPQHVADIFSGRKKFELRKGLPSQVPRRIFLMRSNGESAVVGHINVSKVFRAAPAELWKSVSGGGVAKKRFESYFEGYKQGTAFEIASFCEYVDPIPVAKIREIEPGFRVPQNFLYLDKLPRLRDAFDRLAFRESVRKTGVDISFRRLSPDGTKQFVALVEQHISGSYLETGKAYGEKLVEIDQAESDIEGIFTEKKVILEIYQNKNLVGFTTLTFKVGGAVKTGPTMLLEEYRSSAIGIQVREALHNFLKIYGSRKVYCTAPVNNNPATTYLLKSGYRLEAHLRKHYHDGHDEFVFGYLIDGQRSPTVDFIRQIVPIVRFERLRRQDIEVAGFLENSFSYSYCKTDPQWARRQISLSAKTGSVATEEFKPRRIYLGYANSLVACGLCLLKRGGSAKILLMTNTGHIDSLVRFIEYIERAVRRSRSFDARKFYTHVPVTDIDVTQAFYASGYRVEGILEQPYRSSDDLIVFGKEIK